MRREEPWVCEECGKKGRVCYEDVDRHHSMPAVEAIRASHKIVSPNCGNPVYVLFYDSGKWTIEKL